MHAIMPEAKVDIHEKYLTCCEQKWINGCYCLKIILTYSNSQKIMRDNEVFCEVQIKINKI